MYVCMYLFCIGHIYLPIFASVFIQSSILRVLTKVSISTMGFQRLEAFSPMIDVALFLELRSFSNVYLLVEHVIAT